MPHRAVLDLNFNNAPAAPAQREPLHWVGFTFEHVVLPTRDSYAFASSGGHHYLAAHDLTLADGEMEVSDLPRERLGDLRGTVTFAPAGCTIEGWATPVPRRNAFTALYFDPRLVNEELEQRYTSRTPPPFAHVRDARLLSTMTKLGAVASEPVVDELYAESLCLTAALEVFGVMASPQSGRLSDRQLRRVADYVQEHLVQPIDLSELAAIAGLSRFHFSRAFKVTAGVGPHAFVEQKRIDRAVQLLISTTLTVDEIAVASGFNSPSTFRKAFQRAKNTTPLNYRRQR